MTTLTRQLRSWQRREWLGRAAWGGARWAAAAAAGLAIACAVDWAIDRTRETPFALRVGLTAAQVVAAAGGAYLFVWRLGVPSLDALAGWAEERYPALGHRLVTALQLNRPGARTGGMSAALIAAVTREAEALTATHRLGALADSSRLVKAFALLLPVAAAAAGFAWLRPELATALLARQALLDRDIPRPVAVTNVTPELWPAGDEVEVRVAVAGPVAEDATGVVKILTDGQPDETFPLVAAGPGADGTTVFAAKVPAGAAPFRFRARVAGGRLRTPGAVRFAARPVVEDVAAWVLLPAYVDPAGERRYERFQPQGDVVAPADAAVRVEASASKPVTAAAVVLLRRDNDGRELEAGRAALAVSPDGRRVSGQFDLPARPAAYRIEVTDENGFTNTTPPRRGLTVAADLGPQGHLLAEVLKDPSDDGPLADYDVTGMPLAVGGQVQIGYHVKSALGVSRAYIVYRVNGGPWAVLPLARTAADPAKVGRFVPEMGVFERTAADGAVEFYPLPAADPAADPPGLEAGGRVNFQTAALLKPGPDGKPAPLIPGDEVEYRVVAYDRNPAPAGPPEPPAEEPRPGGANKVRTPWRSASVLKTVKTPVELHAWLSERDESRRKLAELEAAQRRVFGGGGKP